VLASPQLMVHFELPLHAAVHPDGQLMVQLVSPVQLVFEPAPTVTVASAPPPIVIELSGPASIAHSVVPVHVEVQSAAQFSLQVEPPAQASVHPVPQFALHVFLLEQSYVALLTMPPSPPSPASPPKSHTAPGAQLHTLPSH
jgi:hypothetical protein